MSGGGGKWGVIEGLKTINRFQRRPPTNPNVDLSGYLAGPTHRLCGEFLLFGLRFVPRGPSERGRP